MTKEEIKKDAEKLSEAFGYNHDSLSWDVINVKDAYCIGFTKGMEYATATPIRNDLLRIINELRDENGQLKSEISELTLQKRYTDKDVNNLIEETNKFLEIIFKRVVLKEPYYTDGRRLQFNIHKLLNKV